MVLQGTFRILLLYDVADSINLDRLKSILKIRPAERLPSFTHPTPEYVRFELPPVVEPLNPVELETGERLEARIKYYDYGVTCLEMELPFSCEWGTLVKLSADWIAAPNVEQRSLDVVRRSLQRVTPALVKPYDSLLTEDYYIVELRGAQGADGRPATSSELLARYGQEIAQIIRGESRLLSDAERHSIEQSSLSYYPSDLLVVGWTAALVYDTAEGAAPTIQLLEYANTQLLEFRHYDNLLTRVLDEVYRSLERHSGLVARWRLARESERLNVIRLDVMELAERTDNAIKFLSDMFYARLYRIAAAKVGVPDYRRRVDEKLRTAGELYQFMVDQFEHARSFVLELSIVIILIIDLVFLFKGK
ncbi:MAG: hypothetical protein EPN47_07000 [Acidobacteria bacterium]|nr:MAG: hypothetical protein EPN47_07000 [Acidobacteriota bacterium]